MTNNQIFGLLSLADDKYIAEAFPQAKRAPVFTTRRIYALAASVCVIATAVMAGILIPSSSNNLPSASLPEEKPLEYGFKFAPGSGYECSSNPLVSAYKSDTNYFDIDDVTITVYFGYIIFDFEDIDTMHEHGITMPHSVSYFQAIYGTENGEVIYPRKYSEKMDIRYFENDLISEEYRVTPISTEDRLYIKELIFTHSEVITYPKELFKEDYGVVQFQIFGKVGNIGDSSLGTTVGFYYEKIDSKIVFLDDDEWKERHPIF